MCFSLVVIPKIDLLTARKYKDGFWQGKLIFSRKYVAIDPLGSRPPPIVLAESASKEVGLHLCTCQVRFCATLLFCFPAKLTSTSAHAKLAFRYPVILPGEFLTVRIRSANMHIIKSIVMMLSIDFQDSMIFWKTKHQNAGNEYVCIFQISHNTQLCDIKITNQPQ